MDEQLELEPKRRRRRRRSKRGSKGWKGYLRGPAFGRHLFGAMCLIGAGYAAAVFWDVRLASRHYSSVAIGMPEKELRYLRGAPASIEEGGRLYRYEADGRIFTGRLSDRGVLTAIGCTASARYGSGCEKVFGIGIGGSEGQILRRLGTPSRISYRGDDKVMHYDGMGLSFFLRRLRVYAIELHQGGSLAGYLPHALWRMIP